jgi:hypothetical protein
VKQNCINFRVFGSKKLAAMQQKKLPHSLPHSGFDPGSGISELLTDSPNTHKASHSGLFRAAPSVDTATSTHLIED